MLNKIRFVFSLSLIAVLLVSTFILSSPARVAACPIPPPRTLLSLYLRSDVIFVADVTSEKDGKIVYDDENYLSVEIIRNLKVSSILKGTPKRNFVFTTTEYRDKNPSEDATGETEEVDIFRYGYKGASRIKSGERYLFFFTENSETKNYELTDYVSGYKKISDPDLAIYEKRIKELENIVEKKENQLGAITEWLVRCIEEPVTRWDGLFDLKDSVQALEYKDQDDEESNEKNPFVIDEDFYSSTPEIAESLSDSQKERISGIVYGSIQDEMLKNVFYYSLSSLIVNWDKPRLATYAYSFLQTADTTDAEKTKSIMEYIANVSGDDNLSGLASAFPVNDEPETTKEPVEEKTVEQEIVEQETIEEKTEIVSEPPAIVEQPAETVENVEKNQDVLVEKPAAAKTSENPNPTLAQKREKILQEFTSRYEYLLVRNFKAEDETVLAEK